MEITNSLTQTGNKTMTTTDYAYTESTKIDHAEYQKRVKTMDNAALNHVIDDCKRAIEAMPNGHKVGYYTDEIHYCSMELAKRQKQMLKDFAKKGGFAGSRKRAARGDYR